MSQALTVARGQLWYASSSAATSTTAATVLFTPNDFNASQLAMPTGYTAVMVCDEFYISNLDATNNFYIRPITLTGAAIISATYPAAGNLASPGSGTVTVGGTFVAGQPLSIGVGSGTYAYTSQVADVSLSGVAASFLAYLLTQNTFTANYVGSVAGAILTIAARVGVSIPLTTSVGAGTMTLAAVGMNPSAPPLGPTAFLGKQIPNVQNTSVVAAAATDILVPAGTRFAPSFVRSVGFSIVAAVGTPIFSSVAYGGLTIVS